MAAIMGNRIRIGTYCWCCNTHQEYGRAYEKREWEAEVRAEMEEMWELHESGFDPYYCCEDC